MKKRYLQTNFIKFLIEKYEKEIQELPEEETNLSDNKLSDEFDRIINGEEEREETSRDCSCAKSRHEEEDNTKEYVSQAETNREEEEDGDDVDEETAVSD